MPLEQFVSPYVRNEPRAVYLAFVKDHDSERPGVVAQTSHRVILNLRNREVDTAVKTKDDKSLVRIAATLLVNFAEENDGKWERLFTFAREDFADIKGAIDQLSETGEINRR